MAGIAGEMRAVQRRRCVDAGKLIEHASNLALKAGERRHHFGDALAGNVLKVARLENLNHAVADVLREPAFEVALERSR